MGVKNDTFWSEIWSGFEESGGLGNSTGILQLEIQLDHLTNFESTVKETA